MLRPQFSPILINTYREPSQMIVLGKEEIMSQEGRRQEHNLAILFNATEITHLLPSLKIKCPNIKQSSLADDVVGAEKVKNLKIWQELILQG